MKIDEINALIVEVMKCPLKKSSSLEDIFISLSNPYDPSGWKLCISKSLVDYKAACCLTDIINNRRLRMDCDETKKGYYAIYSK